jgi:hypothetical protein
VLKRLLCVVVGHNGGDWAYISRGTCTQSRLCERCRQPLASIERVLHSWSAPAYMLEGACEQRTLCTRCGIEDSAARRVMHILGDYTPPELKSCAWTRSCTRCGWVDTPLTYHQWGRFGYLHPSTNLRPMRRAGDEDPARLAPVRCHLLSLWHQTDLGRCDLSTMRPARDSG